MEQERFKRPKPIDEHLRFKGVDRPQKIVPRKPVKKNIFGTSTPVQFQCSNCGRKCKDYPELVMHKKKCKRSELINVDDNY